MPAQSSLVIAGGPDARDYTFTRNPSKVGASYGSQYADTQIVYDDNSVSTQARNSEWVRNQPARLTVEFTLHASGEGDVEGDRNKLLRLREKDSRTGEPPDLIFTHGPNAWRVRIDSLDFDDKGFYRPSDNASKWLDVRMALRVLRPETSSTSR